MGKLVLLFLGVCFASFADTIAYAIDSQGKLYNLDLTHPSATLIGDSGLLFPEGLALTSDGSLYATTFEGGVFRIDRATGAAIGILSAGHCAGAPPRSFCDDIEGLDALGNRLVASNFVEKPTIFEIDPTHRTTTPGVLASTSTGAIRALTVLDTTHVLAVADQNSLYEIALSTGATSFLGRVPMQNDKLLTGIDFAAGGTLYGVDVSGNLWNIDWRDPGASTILGNTGNQLWTDLTIVSVPEPATWLLGVALLLVWIAARRYTQPSDGHPARPRLRLRPDRSDLRPTLGRTPGVS